VPYAYGEEGDEQVVVQEGGDGEGRAVVVPASDDRRANGKKRGEEVDRPTKTKKGWRGKRILDDERCQVGRREYSSYPKIVERKRNA